MLVLIAGEQQSDSRETHLPRERIRDQLRWIDPVEHCAAMIPGLTELRQHRILVRYLLQCA
jgi:hypothetical protein